MNRQVAVLAGGCFWCLEAVFLEVRGVLSVESGYCGGTLRDPSYEEVCGGRTGHAEAVRVEFDPEQVAYRDLLGVFFGIHDPTTLNRQGADVGPQYRSGIYYHTPEQKEIAETLITELNAQKIWDQPIVTEVEPVKDFYIAEDYHQEYFARNQYQPYCMAVIAPKVSKFRKHYQDLWRKQAT